MSASLRCGVEAVSGASVAVILLGDQPGVTVAAIRKVLDGLGPKDLAARATYHGRPGHPVAIRAELFADITELDGDRGAGALLRDVGARAIECSRLAHATDIDQVADLERFESG